MTWLQRTCLQSLKFSKNFDSQLDNQHWNGNKKKTTRPCLEILMQMFMVCVCVCVRSICSICTGHYAFANKNLFKKIINRDKIFIKYVIMPRVRLSSNFYVSRCFGFTFRVVYPFYILSMTRDDIWKASKTLTLTQSEHE